jgi:tetratricopeptide (TPR) repeat protein
MKKWIITGLVVAALAVAAVSARWWLPKLLPFLKDNTVVIQTLGSAMQIVLWAAAGITFVFRLWFSRREGQSPQGGSDVSQIARDGGINVVGPAKAEGDIVARDKITITQQAAAAVPTPASFLHQLPAPPRDFTGRSEEIRELMEAVGTVGVTISGVIGMGGVGKTALALKFAEQLTPRYPDAQFYLDLKGVSKEPLTPKAAMEYVIRAYQPDAKLPENEAELGGFYRSVLHEKKALLLMDNARDARQVEPLIPPPSCMLVVTSRQHFALPGLAPKNLDALSPPDARALLIRIAPRLAQEKKDYASDLARLCGYLPLALRSVASALAARINVSPAEYVEKLTDARERLKLTATDASLQLSYDPLTAELQKQFRALAIFPDSFDAAGAAAVWETEPHVAEEILGELLVYSLLEFNSASARYRLHDLVRAFAGARLDGEERIPAQLRHARHYKDVLAAAEGLYLQGGESLKKGLALFDMEWGNIQAGQAWAAAHATEDQAAARLCSQYPGFGIHCLSLRLHPRDDIKWLEAGLTAACQLRDRYAEGLHLGNMGTAYFSLGEYRRAIEFHEQALQIAREIGDRRGEGNALGNLGNAHNFLGDYRRAIEYCEQNLKIARETGTLSDGGKSLGNLGIAYKNLGDYRRALEFHEQHLQIARKIGDRNDEGNALGNLGNAYRFLGDYRRAVDYYEQTLEIAREIGDRRCEGSTMGNLGNVYDSLGEYRRAIEFYEQHRQIAREVGDRNGEGNALWNLSLAFDKLGDRAKAIANAEAALEIYEQIEHPGVEKVRRKLAEWRGKA